MKYVDLSGIYQIWNVAYVFWETILNAPSIIILGNNWRFYLSFIAFGVVEGW